MLTIQSDVATTDHEIFTNASVLAHKTGTNREVFEHIFCLERNVALLQKKVELLESRLYAAECELTKRL